MMLNYNSSTRAYIINSGGIDGSYGYGTANAVEAFQVSKNLEVDGSCGPKTWAALRSSLIYKTFEDPYKIYKGPYPYWANQYNMRQFETPTGIWHCYSAYGTWSYVG
ncbi:MAG TPA: peptidoglycan-binding protein [Candidatus Scybalocola faecipullorum]|nr:peptidoglycan-binding protein [Candidatus Scybalocola faecipullorum]